MHLGTVELASPYNIGRSRRTIIVLDVEYQRTTYMSGHGSLPERIHLLVYLYSVLEDLKPVERILNWQPLMTPAAALHTPMDTAINDGGRVWMWSFTRESVRWRISKASLSSKTSSIA